MKMGEGRRVAGGRQGAARRESELPGAEEWLRAEEGALELNFLSPRWRWDLCCHLQGDASCAAAGILMAWEACGGGLQGHPKPLLGQAVGSEATPAAPSTGRLFHFGGVGPPQDLLLGEEGVQELESVLPYPLEGVGDPLAAMPTAGGQSYGAARNVWGSPLL